MPKARRLTIGSAVSRRAYLSPRTIAFNVQGVRLARASRAPAKSACCTACMRPISAGRSTRCSAAASSMAPLRMGFGWALVENMVP